MLDRRRRRADWVRRRARSRSTRRRKDVSSWVVADARSSCSLAPPAARQPVEDPLPAELRARHGCSSLGAALRDDPPAGRSMDDVGRRRQPAASGTRRWSCSWPWPSAGRAAGPSPAIAAAARAPAACSTPFDAALPFDAHRRAARGRRGDRGRAGPRAPDAPAAAGRGRLGQDRGARCGRCCRWSTPAARRRCSRRPRCSPPSTHRAHPASCSARSAGPASSTAPPTGTRVALLTGSQPAAARREALRRGRRRAAPASSSAPTPCSRRASSSPTSGWSSSTSSTGSASSSATRCAAKAQPPAARAGDDRDADPAHGRHDRLRRPGDLHAAPSCPAAAAPIATHVVPAAEKPAWLDRAWQRHPRGGRRRATRRTWSARGSATTTDPTTSPRTPTAPDADDGDRRERRPPLAVLDVAELLRDGPLAGLRIGVLHGRLPAEEKDARDARVRRRRARRAGRHHGRRGRRRRAQRHRDGRHGRRPVRRVASCTSCAAGSAAGEHAGPVPAGHRGARAPPAPASGSTRSPPPPTASSWPGWTWRQRREGDVLGAAQSGRRSSLRLLSLLRDEELIADGPGRGHRAGRDRAPAWPTTPALAAAGRRARRRRARRVPGEGMRTRASSRAGRLGGP